MIETEKRRQEYYMKRQILKEVGGNPTADEVLDYLLGDDNRNSDYAVYKYEYNKRTALNRINMLWVFPLFLCSLPLQWLFTGSTGVSRHSKIGKIVNRLVKFD